MCYKDISGKVVKGEFLKGVNRHVSYGPNLTTFVTYLKVYLNVPFKKLGTLINLMFYINLTDGTISNMLNKMKKLGKTSYDNIINQVADSSTFGADETGIKSMEKIGSSANFRGRGTGEVGL